MAQVIVDNQTYEVPDDATDAEINAITSPNSNHVDISAIHPSLHSEALEKAGIDANELPKNYGLRSDGSPKTSGYFGELKRPDGNISTELSIGVNLDGKEIEIPSLVPTLSNDEINYLLKGNTPTPQIVNKAVNHAKLRMTQNKDVFANQEDVPSSQINNYDPNAGVKVELMGQKSKPWQGVAPNTSNPDQQPASFESNPSSTADLLSQTWDTTKQGFHDLQDFVAPINPADSRITKDIYPDMDTLPPIKNLKTKVDNGEKYTRQDVEQAFFAAAANNPAGKAMGALNILPEVSIPSTIISNSLIPAFAYATGLNPEDIQVMLTGLGLKGGLKEAKSNPLLNIHDENGKFSLRGVSPDNTIPPVGKLGEFTGEQPRKGLKPLYTPTTKTVAKAAANTFDAVTHPLRTTIKAADTSIKTASKIIKPLAQPIGRAVLEGDNFFTGGQGLESAMKTPEAQQARELGKRVGVDFSVAEQTGNPTAKGIEDWAANNARHGAAYAKANNAKTEAVINSYKGTLDKIYPQAVSRSEAGTQLATTYNNTLNKLVDNRRSQAKQDFSAALDGENSTPYIRTDNLFRTAQELKKEGDARLLTPSKKIGAKEANQLLKKLSDDKIETADLSNYTGYASPKDKINTTSSPVTLEEMANGLSDFSAMSKQSGGIFDNIETAAKRRVYARLHEALLKDLDAEIENPQTTPNRAAALRQARTNYAENSNKISDIENTTLGKLIGGTEYDSEGNLNIVPEKVADKFTSMEPTEVLNTLKFLDGTHPDVANMVRRYTLEKVLTKANEGKGLSAEGIPGEERLSKAVFVKSLPDKDTLKAILKNNPHAANEILDVAEAINRMRLYGGSRKGSDTAMRLSFKDMFSVSKIAQSLAADTLAEDLLNPSKRGNMAKEAQDINKQIKPGE